MLKEERVNQFQFIQGKLSVGLSSVWHHQFQALLTSAGERLCIWVDWRLVYRIVQAMDPSANIQWGYLIAWLDKLWRLPGLTQGQSKKKCKIMVIHLYAVSEMMNSVSGSLSLQLLSEFSRRKTWTSGLLRPGRMSSKQVDRRPFRVSELSIWLLYFEFTSFTSFTCHVQTICVLKFNTQKLAVTTNNKPHLTIFISKGIQQNTHKRT